MTSSRQLSKLFCAISERDWGGVESVASEICRTQEDRGHYGVAKSLRGSLRPNQPRNADSPYPLTEVAMTNSANQFLNSLKPMPATVSLADVRLRRPARQAIDGLLAEWKHCEALVAAGLAPRRKLLFHGPPGVGKSMTALALGHELALPVYLVRFDAIIGAYLGQTAVQLRQLFQLAESTACVLLIDEIDALGKQRGNPLDVGELDRIVIALMQELEHSQPKGVVIATSNLPSQLDLALWRRFDLAVAFPAPTKAELSAFGRRQAKEHNLKFSRQLESATIACKNFSDAQRVLLSHARQALIQQFEDADGQATEGH